MEFVAKNVKYPEAAMKAGKEGKVILHREQYKALCHGSTQGLGLI